MAGLFPPPLRVHLVHGTWAKGMFGRSKAWTEPGHEVYERLRAVLPAGTSIETFIWSGANSVRAREEGARLLRAHLENSLRAFPSDRHVLVAHSRGGTIASLAVAGTGLDGRVRGRGGRAAPGAGGGGAARRGGRAAGGPAPRARAPARGR